MRRPTAAGFRKCLKSNLQLELLLLGIALGIDDIRRDPRKVMYVGFVGQIFLNMLKVVILPLIVSSLITGLAQMEVKTSGKIGSRAVIFYLVTTLFAVFLGIGLVMAIQPGTFGRTNQGTGSAAAGRPTTVADPFLDLIRNMFPPNIVQATIFQYRTKLVEYPMTNSTVNLTDILPEVTTTTTTTTTTTLSSSNTSTPAPLPIPPTYDHLKIEMEWVEGLNVLGIVVFSIVLGISISRAGPKGKPLADFFCSLNDVIMHVVAAIMWLAPIGVCFIVCQQILEVDNFGDLVSQLGMYFMTVCVGLLIHSVAVLPICYIALTRKNPFPFMLGTVRALVTGFATGSSTATLPVTIECCEENCGIDPRITRFVLPIGATINMHGTALYEAVAALFIAQLNDVPLDFGKIMAVSITATAAAIGAAGIPQAGLVTLVMVLDTVGLPADKVGTILAIDWLLDRIRTTVNILGDIVGAGVVNHQCKGYLRKLDAADAKTADELNVDETVVGNEMLVVNHNHHPEKVKVQYEESVHI